MRFSKKSLVAGLLRCLKVDRLDLDQREVAFALFWGTDLTGDGIAGLEVKFSNLGR